jgi:two-component system, NarL family, response regulator LiaR
MEEAHAARTRILLVDDHPLLRTALRDVIEREPDLEIVGEAGDGQQAIQMCASLRPDVVVMDIAMPVMDGVTATKRIKAAQPLTAILILTVHTDVVTIFKILQAGASGYLIKSIFGPEVVHTIRAVMDGDTVLAPSVSEELLKYALRHFTPVVEPRPAGLLTKKELEILGMAARGMANKEIARRLGVSEGTVKNYFVELFQKLNVRSRTEAIFVGLKKGILSIEDLG